MQIERLQSITITAYGRSKPLNTIQYLTIDSASPASAFRPLCPTTRVGNEY